jgi:hypothetical protein
MTFITVSLGVEAINQIINKVVNIAATITGTAKYFLPQETPPFNISLKFKAISYI